MTSTLAKIGRDLVDECKIAMTQRENGDLFVVNTAPLGEYPRTITSRFIQWAEVKPEQAWISERGPDGKWAAMTYGEGLAAARHIAAYLLGLQLSAEQPLVILSGNSVNHALMAMGAMLAGIAYVPLAPAYSLVSTDYKKLRYIFDLLQPGLVYADDGQAFWPAFDRVGSAETTLVVAQNAPIDPRVVMLKNVLRTEITDDVDAAIDLVGPETIAKFIFTSGSSGKPKAVITTHKMMCSNVAQGASHFPYLAKEPLILLDWLPWNHVSGGSHNFNLVIHLGGTFYIDGGRPTPDGIHITIENLRDISPNWYFNMPAGYSSILPYLENEPDLCRRFFRNVKVCLYAGAGIDEHVWSGMNVLARRFSGREILFSTSLGSTETAPLALIGDAQRTGVGVVGLPVRGLELKLVGGPTRWEARVRGPNVTPGYWRAPELTKSAFDDEGFYKLGDALRFVDPVDVARGFYFDGRIGEDFKLATGTWVATGPLRRDLVEALSPFVQDAIVLGQDKSFIAALVFIDVSSCGQFLGLDGKDVESMVREPKLLNELDRRLNKLAERATGTSTFIKRILVMSTLPDAEMGEVTDKGAVSRARILETRSDEIQKLFDEPVLPNLLRTRT